ncbi:hypothetical protein RRF57_010830 [Xylaria bambusicola]|uniref:Uncharacterized protein n=1 Tax=Xylaria bambusicola TaxID=326684 RepID=A0AAN7UX75_9PEZI
MNLGSSEKPRCLTLIPQKTVGARCHCKGISYLANDHGIWSGESRHRTVTHYNATPYTLVSRSALKSSTTFEDISSSTVGVTVSTEKKHNIKHYRNSSGTNSNSSKKKEKKRKERKKKEGKE